MSKPYRMPSYRVHKLISQAVASIGGRDHDLGKAQHRRQASGV